MARYLVNGMKVWIAGTITLTGADLTSSNFSAATWVQIKGLIDVADLGDDVELVKTSYIDFSRVETLDGILDGGTKTWRFGLDDTDQGQIDARAASLVKSQYMMKVELTDKPSAGSSPKNATRLFAAKILPPKEIFGTANNQQIFQMMLAVNSNVVRVAASAS